MPVVRALLELAEVGPQDVVYDLGSGDGRIPITAAKEFGARGVGIDIDPALVTQAQANAREAGVEDKVEFRLGDMYAADVRSATVVTLFLHPGPNLKLREKLRSELPAGSRVVSYVWDMGGWTPAEVRRINEHRIFLWRIPSREDGPIAARGARHQRPLTGPRVSPDDDDALAFPGDELVHGRSHPIPALDDRADRLVVDPGLKRAGQILARQRLHPIP